MNKYFCSIAIASVLSVGCATTPSDESRVRIDDEAGMAPLLDKRLGSGENYTVFNSDGSLSGEVDGSALEGSWIFANGLFCRSLTAGPESEMEMSSDCQVLEMSGNTLHGTRERGNGESFSYEIGEWPRHKPLQGDYLMSSWHGPLGQQQGR